MRDVAGAGGAAEMLLADEGDEVCEMAKIYGLMIDQIYRTVERFTLTQSGATAILQTMRKTRGRLTTPLVRDDGVLRPASWDEALDRAAAGFARAREADTSTSFGIFSCSKASNEMNFLAQKFARQVMGTNNIDSCNRT